MNENQELFKQYSDKMTRASQSSYEQFDKAILTLSSGGLGLSIIFITDFQNYNGIDYTSFLIISWVFFCLSILTTLLSFVFSQKASKLNIEFADKYYLKNKEEYFSKTNPYSKATKYLNYLSGTFFLIAVVITLIFVSINL